MYQSKVDVDKCKESGRRLYDYLDGQGIQVRGFGVGEKDDKSSIQIYLLTDEDMKYIPDTFEGFAVTPVVTGEIVAL